MLPVNEKMASFPLFPSCHLKLVTAFVKSTFARYSKSSKSKLFYIATLCTVHIVGDVVVVGIGVVVVVVVVVVVDSTRITHASRCN